MNRSCTVMCMLVAVVPCLEHRVAAQAPTHIENFFGWRREAVPNAALDARLAAAAAQYRRYAPIPRIALYDIAYPKDSAEAAALGENGVLVVTAVVQDTIEIPLRRVYVATLTGISELTLIAAVASYTSDSLVRATFGQFRLDAVYLLPLSLRSTAGDLLTDFATHRDGFRFTHFDGQRPPALQELGTPVSRTGPPSPPVLWAFMRREYPDLANVLGPR
jgi:hypothetical protein